MTDVNRALLRELRVSEEQRFLDTHPRSLALFEQAKATLVGGVPMNWMQRWPGGVPIFVEEASGTVDETLAILDRGRVQSRRGNIGPPIESGLTTKIVEFNDVDAHTMVFAEAVAALT